jgi:hypothetical protein
MDKKLYSLFGLCLLVNMAFGQFQQGLRMGKYTSLYQMMLNPAAAPEGNAINLIQGGINAHNNIIGVEKANTMMLLPGKNGQVIVYPRGRVKYPQGNSGVPDTLFGFFQDSLNNHFAYGSFILEGPSAVVAVNENISIGLALRMKGQLGAFDIPQGMIPFTHAAQPFYATYPIEPFTLSGAVYAEIPLTLALRKIVGFNVLSLGTSIKGLLPMMSAFVDSRNTLNISQRPANNFNLANVDGEMAFSVWSRNPIDGTIKKSLNGFGLGLDIGARLTEGEGRWFVGAALTDLGYIGFKKNTTTYQITSSGVSSHSGLDYIRSISNGNVIQAGNLLSTDILGSSLAGITGTDFNMFLPASFHFQAGFSIGDAFFISSMANVPLLKAKKKLQSIQSFMIMPSWESGFWAIRLPLTLIERKSFTTGFALRAGPLTLGTDHIGSWVTTATLTGSDIYVALQLPIFYDNNRQRKGSAGKNSNLFRCYTF